MSYDTGRPSAKYSAQENKLERADKLTAQQETVNSHKTQQEMWISDCQIHDSKLKNTVNIIRTFDGWINTGVHAVMGNGDEEVKDFAYIHSI